MHTATDHTLAALQRVACDADAIEWEELPSMADSLRERLVVLGQQHRGFGPTEMSVWASTMPAGLAPLADRGAEPVFAEVVQGLAVREVNEPDVFRHFFG